MTARSATAQAKVAPKSWVTSGSPQPSTNAFETSADQRRLAYDFRRTGSFRKLDDHQSGLEVTGVFLDTEGRPAAAGDDDQTGTRCHGEESETLHTGVV